MEETIEKDNPLIEEEHRIIEKIEEKIAEHKKIAVQHEDIVAGLEAVKNGLTDQKSLEVKVLEETKSEELLEDLTTREEITPPKRNYQKTNLFQRLLYRLFKKKDDYDSNCLLECDWGKENDETREFQKLTDREARIVSMYHLYEQRKDRLKYKEAERMLLDGIIYIANENLKSSESPSEKQTKILSERQAKAIIDFPEKALEKLRGNQKLYDPILTRLVEIKKEEAVKKQNSYYCFPD